MKNIRKFVYIVDVHFGYERDSSRHKRPIHDAKAMSVALQFIKDFKPTDIILGGDILDCGCISHHNKNKPGRTEDFRLRSDAKELRREFLEPLESLHECDLRYIIGNHEAWLADFIDENPALEGIIDLRSILQLGDKWKIIPRGEAYNLGKLTFIHGDQFKGGGDHVAKAAVIAYERSVRLGHFHTQQTYIKTSALDIKQGKSGMVVPCLSRKAPMWVKGAPNKWCQGFLFGYVRRDGSFNDYPVMIVNGRAIINGKEYVG